MTPEELSAIGSYTFTIPRMQAVRDMFLFSCNTGFAYVDVAHLTRANLDRTPDGLCWLRKRRQKTRLNSQVPVFKPAMELIRRYANINRMSSDARLFQVIINQKFNAYLKELADVCGIEKNLTFHVARHTFATTVILQNGVSVNGDFNDVGHYGFWWSATENGGNAWDRFLVSVNHFSYRDQAPKGYGLSVRCVRWLDFDGDEVCHEDEVPGCVSSDADNYDSSATEDDCSCLLALLHARGRLICFTMVVLMVWWLLATNVGFKRI